jgi:hypothetical protein
MVATDFLGEPKGCCGQTDGWEGKDGRQPKNGSALLTQSNHCL